MNIKVISVGKTKEKYLIDAVNEYSKRLTAYCDLKFIELQAEEINDENLYDKYRKLEAEKILKHIKSTDSYIITLEILGKNISSEDFAQKINEITISGVNEIIFIIGGANGLDDSIKQLADFKLSFSKMTFTHQFSKIILLEQIYRAFKILKNEPYHR